MRPLNVSNLIGCGGTISHPMWKCTEVCRSAQKCVEGNMEVHRDAQGGAQECAEVCRICGVAQKCVESAQ